MRFKKGGKKVRQKADSNPRRSRLKECADALSSAPLKRTRAAQSHGDGRSYCYSLCYQDELHVKFTSVDKSSII